MRSEAERDGVGLEAAHFGAADFGAADALAESFQRSGGQPGIAYGIVAGGRLVHAGGYGQRRAGADGEVPDAGTVFRIASMTKSFTAAAMLTLRDGAPCGWTTWPKFTSRSSAAGPRSPRTRSGSGSAIC